jgi:Ankyrin repeat
MKNDRDELFVAIETHSVKRIRTILDAGFDPKGSIKGKPLVTHLIEMYTRSDQFPACLQLLLDRGAVMEDPIIAPVLLDDANALEADIKQGKTLLQHRTSLTCAFTPLVGATLLHVAAEYGSIKVAKRLLAMGAEVDARAATDAHGLGGHTPLFHTVNSNANRSLPVMRALLDAGARVDVRLNGITWGRGFEWETTCFDVTPISYAQLGLLPQMHRDEADCYANIKTLLDTAGRPVPPLDNVPNRYLAVMPPA